jgi:hypothetical protein
MMSDLEMPPAIGCLRLARAASTMHFPSTVACVPELRYALSGDLLTMYLVEKYYIRKVNIHVPSQLFWPAARPIIFQALLTDWSWCKWQVSISLYRQSEDRIPEKLTFHRYTEAGSKRVSHIQDVHTLE